MHTILADRKGRRLESWSVRDGAFASGWVTDLPGDALVRGDAAGRTATVHGTFGKHTDVRVLDLATGTFIGELQATDWPALVSADAAFVAWRDPRGTRVTSRDGQQAVLLAGFHIGAFDTAGRHYAGWGEMGRVRVWRLPDWSVALTAGQSTASHVASWAVPFEVLSVALAQMARDQGYDGTAPVMLRFQAVRRRDRASMSDVPVWGPISRAQVEDGGPLFSITGVEIDPQPDKLLVKRSFTGRAPLERLPLWLQEEAAAAGARPGGEVELSYDYETDTARLAPHTP